MLYALFAVLIAFCAVVGVGVADNNGGAGAVVIFSLTALAVLQVSYLAALILVHELGRDRVRFDLDAVDIDVGRVVLGTERRDLRT